MDADQILKRIEIHREYLNGQRNSPDFLAGVAHLNDVLVGIVCALEAAEEKEAEEEMRREALEEMQEEFE